MSLFMDGSFGLPMFRKKRVKPKYVYKIMPIQRNGILLCRLPKLYLDLLLDFKLFSFNIFDSGGLSMPIDKNQPDLGISLFEQYLLKYANVSIWVPESYSYV